MDKMLSRRAFIGITGTAGLALASPGTPDRFDSVSSVNRPALSHPDGSPDAVARDEAYWRSVAAYYSVPSGYANLEAGYFGMMAAPVMEEYHQQIDRVNFYSSYFAREEWDEASALARDRVAQFLGAKPSEIVFTRGATEALQRLIVQYNRLRPGDQVLYADLDFHSMQFAMDALADLRGVSIVRIQIPEPATRENVFATYEEAFNAHPRIRMLLLTHLNNKTGLIVPVREIVAMARERGIDAIVDAAHSFGQCDLKLEDMDADFVGMNLHKWLGAPVGVGAMYVKNSRLADVDRMLGDPGPLERIESRIHTGTANFATFLTVPAALDFHDAIGSAQKAARVRYLRDQWVSAVRAISGIEILTPDDPESVAAITSFRVNGRTAREDNQAIVKELFERYQLFTVWRTGLAHGDCVRVTPALYNTPDDCKRLASALSQIASRA